MTGRTHFLIGTLAGIAIAQQTGAQSGVVLLAGAAAGIGALVPDIDTPRALISQLFFPIAFLFRLFKVAHRGLTHSIPALLFVAVICYLLYLQHPALSLYLLVFVAGYASHMIADMLTPAGISLLYPMPVKIKLLPAIVSHITTPALDMIILMACVVGIAILLFGGDNLPYQLIERLNF